MEDYEDVNDAVQSKEWSKFLFTVVLWHQMLNYSPVCLTVHTNDKYQVWEDGAIGYVGHTVKGPSMRTLQFTIY